MSERKDLSPADQRRQRMDALFAAVEQRSDILVTLLADTGISFDRFKAVFRRALIKGQENPNTDLLLADAGSVVQSCIDCCTAGLLPDGKQGAIVIFNVNVAQRGEQKRWLKKAQFIPMYEGLLSIAYGSGNFQSIMAHVVYDVDEWDYELGIDPWIKHKPGPRPPVDPPENRPAGWLPYPVKAAYAVAKTTNGGVFMEVFEPEDIRKVMAVSRAKSGPAKDWAEQMARKGPLRRMWKFLPRDNRMDRVLELDDENYDLDSVAVAEERPAPALKTGFAPKQQAALPQGADPVVDIPMDQGEELADEAETTSGGDDAPVDRGRDVEPESADRVGEGQADESQPARLREYQERLAAAQNWLNIKQALRGLYKAEDWDRLAWERATLSSAWERKEAVEDRTDFVTDCWCFACWLAGADPTADAIAGNLRVLESQADFKRAPPEMQSWVRGLAAFGSQP